MQRLILASASPQRKELLAALGMKFDVLPSTIDEPSHPETDPAKRAVILAREKAADIAKQNPDTFVIGCDTLVVAADGTLLEKPANESEARNMLEKQSGKTSVVHSGLCVINPQGKIFEGLSSSNVRFKKLSKSEIDWWMRTKLWKDRSGSFQIDGLGQFMIEHMEGDFTSIVGLPVFLLGELMNKAGHALLI